MAESVVNAPEIVMDDWAWQVPAAIAVPLVVTVPVPTDVPRVPDVVGSVNVGVPAADGT